MLPGGPVINNDEQGYNWLTYPERLEAAGVSWKIYQDVGIGLDPAGGEGWTNNPYIGNFGDNSVLYFLQYQNAQPSSPLYEKARTGTDIYNGGSYDGGSFFTNLRNDVMNNALPEVSWVVAPQAYCEHPTYPPNWGAWYISNVLDALTANPEVWASTVLIINFDENDGFFDHIVPPTAPASAAEGMSTVSTVNEIYPGHPHRHRQLCHGSVRAWRPRPVPGRLAVEQGWLRLLANLRPYLGDPVHREALRGDGIAHHAMAPRGLRRSDRRRSISSAPTRPCRRCRTPPTIVSFVSGSELVPLTLAEIAAGQQPVANLTLSVPADQTMPVQEPGQRLARALPYQLQADAQPHIADQTLSIDFRNTGSAGVFFHVRSALGASNSGQGMGPWGYTVDPVTRSVSDTWRPTSGTDYDLSVFGPNGFFRRYAGGLTTSSANLSVESIYDTIGGGITVSVTNFGAAATNVNVVDNYTGHTKRDYLRSGERLLTELNWNASSRWYDVLITADSDPSFIRHYAGHVETGADGLSDPLIGTERGITSEASGGTRTAGRHRRLLWTRPRRGHGRKAIDLRQAKNFYLERTRVMKRPPRRK